MATAVTETFMTAPTADRLRMVRGPNNTAVLTLLLGEAAYAEYTRLAERLDEEHLSVIHPPNLIFVPGIMGSLLQSKTKGGLWWVDVRTLRHIDDLRLAPNGQQDVDVNNQVVPCAVDPSYEAFLTAVLERDDFGHEVFAYDWRKPLRLSVALLRDMVLKVYEDNGHEPVHLVAPTSTSTR